MVGYSLHIGLNAVDPVHYQGWDGKLNACELDMQAMAQLATASGFQSLGNLKTAAATRQSVLDNIRDAASTVKAGDIFLITYSGHGGQIPDMKEPEENGNDETWCLYDGQMLDDELKLAWLGFPAGVRVLIVSDSCHSGGIDKFAVERSFGSTENGPLIRQAPATVLQQTYFANRNFYDGLQDAVREASGSASERDIESQMLCSALLMAACHDFELSYEAAFGGYFTSALVSVWNFGQFTGSYNMMRSEIAAQLPSNQNPQIKVFGKVMPGYANQKPFAL